ncbi:hypothetical protein [Thermofilum pendens]|uniref:Uncharacterized protein n=1 Tax=Thermofilum pendens (strain DSM 2475 / Hrk 5) TaxID=368408 RepID=A1S1C6_THEPD|nr:hypothetical protein [Thermofilum pendens]ABL79256.1 hypothetical protein Tpen_1861 [Thermofilum pendens Hrk 5]
MGEEVPRCFCGEVAVIRVGDVLLCKNHWRKVLGALAKIGDSRGEATLEDVKVEGGELVLRVSGRIIKVREKR